MQNYKEAETTWKKHCVVEIAKHVRYSFVWIVMSIIQCVILYYAMIDKAYGAVVFGAVCLVACIGALVASVYEIKQWRKRYEIL